MLKHTGRHENVRLHFDRLGITLLVHAVIREQKLNHVLIQILSVRRVAKTGLRDVFNDHGLQVVLLDHRVKRAAVLVNHVRETVGRLSVLLLSHLTAVLGFDLRADFSERRNLAAADILNLNDVEAVFRADRADNIALLRTENRGFKCRNHCPFAEPAEVTALLGAARVDRFLLRDSGELIRMSLQLGNNRLSLLFSGLLVASEANQNVAGFALLRCGELLRVLLVISLDVFFSRLRVHELIRREHHVLHLLVLGVHEISLVAVVVSLGLRVRDLNRLDKAGRRNLEQTHFAALTEQLIQLIH